MKKAISFFTVTTFIFLISLGISAFLNFGLPYTTSGILALSLGIFFIFLPLEFLHLIGILLKIPVIVLIILTWIILGSVLVGLCLLELTLPLIIGYLVLNAFDPPTYIYLLGLMIYVTLFLAFRNRYMQLVFGTWYAGINFIENILRPVVDFLRTIDHVVHSVYFWLRREN